LRAFAKIPLLNSLNKNIKCKMFISADNTKMADMVKDEDREQPQHWRYSDLLGE